jgi:TonB family protein
MPPSVKEKVTSTAKPEAAQRPSPTSTSPAEAKPVALEVPVTVNGARALDGSEKREPFSETTKTVLVFGSGAVIRLSSAVAPGQLLFLTNERTKKEVVCQVVKSKNYRNVSGYVELEFTESVVGFWGMRFPSDRIGSASQNGASAPVAASSSVASGSTAIPRPVAPKIEAAPVNASPSVVATKSPVPGSTVREVAPKPAESKSVIPAAPKVGEPVAQKPVAPVAPLSSSLSTSFDPEAPLKLPSTKPLPPAVPVTPAAPVLTIPEVPVTPAAVKPSASESALFDSPRVSESQASFLEPAKPAGVPMSVPNLLSLFEAKPSAPPVTPPSPAPPAVDPETEALKQHTARLQEQLSNMMFSGEAAAPETVSVEIPDVPPVEMEIRRELAENAARVLGAPRASTPEPLAVKPVEQVKVDPLPASSLEDEQLKIPAWLEPLARNAAAPSSTQELIEREKAKRLAEQPKAEEIHAETLPVMEELHVPELPMPTFGDALPIDEERSKRQSGSKSSSKGMLYGAIAAGVLALAGGGWWYMQQQSGGVHAGGAPAQSVEASVVSTPTASLPSQPEGNALPRTNPAPQTTPAALTNTSGPSNPASNTLSVVPVDSTATAARNAQLTSKPSNSIASATSSAPPEPVVEQPKKPILGEVRLAAPKVNANKRTQNGVEPDPGITLSNEEPADSGAEALNAGLIAENKQPSAPAAPLAVGGDVKPAKLISSMPPIYPALAKNQHVSGNVLVDALIDANGRVTTMKVVSGPTLLHQAAMDALKQWRYQPASLDGKPVAMHLTVTLQFRLQ